MMSVTKCARVVVRQLFNFKITTFVSNLLFSGRYAMVALRKVNFNQIPKIIPKIPVSIVKHCALEIHGFSKENFTITAEIHARSLANFYGQYAERHMNLKFMQLETLWSLANYVSNSTKRTHQE